MGAPVTNQGTMKAVIGIDSDDLYKPALNLLGRLRFPGTTATLVHSVEALFPDGTFPPFRAEHPLGDLDERMRESAKALLASAAKDLEAYGIPSESEIARGDPFRRVLEVADRERADLVAAGSAQKPRWESLFFGSVSRGLTTSSKHSILVGKAQPRDGEGLVAVVATDHSEYGDRCIDKLIDLSPQGIDKLIVMTSYAMDADIAPLMLEDWDREGTTAEQAIVDRLDALNAEVCDKLDRYFPKVETRILCQHPADAIRTVMQETEADLLIMGSHGHGTLERLALGSVSFHQVVATPHNVLVVRA